MTGSRLREWPLVAGVLVSVGLFVAAEPLNAEGGDTAVVMRPAAGETPDAGEGAISSSHVDYVAGLSESKRSGRYRFRIAGAGHTPAAGARWGLTATASDGNEPLEGTVRVDVMMDSTVVRHVRTGKLRHGSHTESWAWPDQAIGAEFTVRVTLENDAISQTFLYPLKVSGRN